MSAIDIAPQFVRSSFTHSSIDLFFWMVNALNVQTAGTKNLYTQKMKRYMAVN